MFKKGSNKQKREDKLLDAGLRPYNMILQYTEKSNK